jgi:signal transduction histidine kinase
MVVTIVLCGLLIGEFFIGVWTLIACVLHIGVADVTDWGWQVHVGWCVVYVMTASLVTVFTRNLERLLAAQSDAEAQQRDAIVAERTRFARDIHDTLAQGFTGILMQLNAAEQRLPAGSEALTHIATARDLARDSLEEARRSVGALRAGALTRGTLLGAIEQIAHTLTANSSTQVVAHLEGQPYPLTEQHESALLRIAQEALTNAVRHAGAARITVRLSYQTGSVVLAVHDDGRGLTGREPSGLGIDGMRQRASQIRADIQIVSHPAEGTGIVVTLPHG